MLRFAPRAATSRGTWADGWAALADLRYVEIQASLVKSFKRFLDARRVRKAETVVAPPSNGDPRV